VWNPTAYKAFLAMMSGLRKPEACFLSGIKAFFIEHRGYNDLRRTAKGGHNVAAYLYAILLYRDNGGAAADDEHDEHDFQHMSPTHYPSWPSPRIHWSATGPRNQHTTFRPENAAEHQTSSLQTNTGQTGEHHQSDRSLLVKLGNFH
jgi:hypothetical protein